MQTSVLLSIKPQFAEQIFDGSKQYEFRRKLFRDRSVKKIVVYVTAPVSQVIGEFEIEEVIELDLKRLWTRTRKHSGIQKCYFDSYFDGLETGYAIKIGKTKRYAAPLDLEPNFNVKRAPQSFVYVSR